MCIACEIKNGGRTEILDNPSTDYKIYIENAANIFRLHMKKQRKKQMKILLSLIGKLVYLIMFGLLSKLIRH